MNTNVLSGERSNTKFLTTFSSKEQAEICKRSLILRGYEASQVAIIRPNEVRFGRKIEPESQGIFKTALRAHLVLGAVGLVLGIAVWFVLYRFQIAVVYSSPLLSLVPFVFISTALGLMLGGAVTLRPDHQRIVQGIKEAQKERLWSLIVHSRGPEQSSELEHWFALNQYPAVRSF